MSESSSTKPPIRFGAEFGPARSPTTQGVGLSTFKAMVWMSNIGGLLLVVIALEMMVVQGRFGWGLTMLIAGVAIALFPSQFEIVGMEVDEDE